MAKAIRKTINGIMRAKFNKFHFQCFDFFPSMELQIKDLEKEKISIVVMSNKKNPANEVIKKDLIPSAIRIICSGGILASVS